MTEQKNKTLSAKEAALDDKQDVEIDLEKDGDSIVGGIMAVSNDGMYSGLKARAIAGLGSNSGTIIVDM